MAPRRQVANRHPRRGQGLGVGHPLVAQRIELGGHDQRRREVRTARRAAATPWDRGARPGRRSGPRTTASGRPSGRSRRRCPGMRRGSVSESVTGVSSTWPTMSGPPASRASWQATAATLPPALQPATASWPGMPPSSIGVGGDPLHGREGVVGCRREPGLGRVPVVHRHDDGIGPHAQVTAEGIVGVLAAEHPAAAVEVGDDRVGAGGCRPVQPVAQFPGGTGQHAVDDLAHLRARRTHRCHRLHERPGVLDRSSTPSAAAPWPP